MNGRQVTWAKTHTPVFVPGIATFKETLTAGPTGNVSDLKMMRVEGGLLCTCKKVEFFIPDANITHMILAPEKSQG